MNLLRLLAIARDKLDRQRNGEIVGPDNDRCSGCFQSIKDQARPEHGTGDDLDQLGWLAEQISARLAEIPGTVDATTDFRPDSIG